MVKKNLIVIIVSIQSIIFYFTSKLFNILTLVRDTEEGFSNIIRFCSSSANSDLKVLKAPLPAYEKMK